MEKRKTFLLYTPNKEVNASSEIFFHRTFSSIPKYVSAVKQPVVPMSLAFYFFLVFLLVIFFFVFMLLLPRLFALLGLVLRRMSKLRVSRSCLI
jgi:hypothetical protein